MAFDLDDEELEMTRVKIHKLPPKRDIQKGDYFRTVDGTIDEVVDFNKSVCPYFDVRGASGQDYDKEDITKYDPDLLNIIRRGDIVNGSKVVNIGCRVQYVENEESDKLITITNGIQLENSITIYFVDKIKDVLSYEKYKEQSFKREVSK